MGSNTITYNDKDITLLSRFEINPKIDNPNSEHLLLFYWYLKDTLWPQLYWSNFSWAIAQNFTTKWIFFNADMIREQTTISDRRINLNTLWENRWLDKSEFIDYLKTKYWNRTEEVLLKSFIINMNLLWTDWLTQHQSYFDPTEINTWTFGSYCIWVRTFGEITYYYILEFDKEWWCIVKEYDSNSGEGWSTLINPSVRTITFWGLESD